MAVPAFIKQLFPARMTDDDFYIGLSAMLLVWCMYGIWQMVSPRERTGARIKAIQERRKDLQSQLSGPKRRKNPEMGVGYMRSVAMKLKLIQKSQANKTESMLSEAGFRSKDAIYILAFSQLVMPTIMGVIGFLIKQYDFGYGEKYNSLDYMWPLVGVFLGYKLPMIYIGRVKKKRHIKVRRSLSDTLDLMTICAEAGLSLNMMLERVARELTLTYPEMSEELALTSVEIGFLPDRNKALLNLAERCTLPEIRGIVSVLIQTEKYGTPIAQALRVLSAEFRQSRMLLAEQKAARLPALMTVPMIVFILPTLFIVIMAPAIITASKNFKF